MNVVKFDDGVNERGFFSVVLQMISIKILNRNVPFHIDLSNWKLYQNKPNDNVWEYYFEQYYKNCDNNIKMNLSTLVNYADRFRALTIIRNDIKTLKVKKHILEKIAIYDSYFKNKRVLGIHKRGTDSGEHRPILPIEEYYKEIDKIINEYDYLYVCGDEKDSVEKFKERYSDKIFIYESAFRSDSKHPIHKLNPSTGVKFFTDCEPYKQGEDVLIEAILLSKCNYLLLTDSNVAFFSIYYNNNRFKFLDNAK